MIALAYQSGVEKDLYPFTCARSGREIECGAHLVAMESGSATIGHAVSLERVEAGQMLPLLSPYDMLPSFPVLALDNGGIEDVRYGRVTAVAEHGLSEGQLVRLVHTEMPSWLVAIGEVAGPDCVRPRRVRPVGQ